jgi:hypothetical protein
MEEMSIMEGMRVDDETVQRLVDNGIFDLVELHSALAFVGAPQLPRIWLYSNRAER